VKIYSGSDTTGTLVQTLTPTRSSATWTTTATTLAQGVYTAQATQTDTAGNTGASTANTFTVDTTAPNVPTFTIPSLIRNGQSLTATSVSDNGGGSGVQKVEYFWCRTGGACAPATSIGSSTIAGTNYLVTWSAQPADNTNYRLLARVTDVAGNTTDSAIQTTQIDNTAPTVTLTSPASGSFTNNTSPTFTGACTTGDGNVTVTIKQSGTTVQTPTGACGSGTYSATATALPQAAYTAQASQTDAAGNTGTSATNTFTVDTTTPTVSSVALVNHGSTTGRVDASDTIVVTFSEQMKVSSFCSTWVSGDGNNQSLASNNDVTVTLTDGGASNDSISVSSGTCSFNFGTVNLGSTAYITGGTRTFSGSGSSKSSIASDATAHTLTITLGSSDSNGSVATVTSSVATYTPSASIADSAGNSGVAAKSTANVKQF
jgi:hypothetical protein